MTQVQPDWQNHLQLMSNALHVVMQLLPLHQQDSLKLMFDMLYQ